MDYRKIKSISKVITPKGDKLSEVILKTMKTISDMVGATLGPNGCPVLIERQEYGFSNLITKDGVTVFKSLGFTDPIAHSIMETARDAAIRTAQEAGDGTTAATVLAEAIVRHTNKYCKANPKVAPQVVVRILQDIFKTDLEPLIKKWAITEPDKKLLHAVAQCSANGEKELADAIVKCFELAGDGGNITIIEKNGPTNYEVDVLKGYPVTSGYEESCGRFYPMFLNDRANSRIYLENVVFILYFSELTETQALFPILEPMGIEYEKWLTIKDNPQAQMALPPEPPRNVVIVANKFSEKVIADLAHNFSKSNTLNIVPLLMPKFPTQNGQMQTMEDLQAITGSKIFDHLDNKLVRGKPSDLGPPLEFFEMHRYRSNIVGMADESYVLARVETVQKQLKTGSYESINEQALFEERLGKLTGGIAKLTVVAPSNGEIREKKDRAEDATCAIRGAIAHGCLPGGCWTLERLISELHPGPLLTHPSLRDIVIHEILIPSLHEPLIKLLDNCGYNEGEIFDIIDQYHSGDYDYNFHKIYNPLVPGWVSAVETGVMDSVPAVLEALRSSISIATLLGTLGGLVVYPRDTELERKESSETYDWLRAANEQAK